MKKLTDRVQYFARRFLFLSVLDPATFERQALINKTLMVFLVALLFAFVNLLLRFNALDAEIAVRRSTSIERVRAWNEKMAADSIQRLQWATLQKAEQLKQQDDSIRKTLGGINGSGNR